MMCKAPITITNDVGPIDVPCGQCMPCRINKGRKWTARLLLEQQHHANSIFVTLSYKSDQRSPGENLVKTDLQKYFKRLRKAGIKFRYFAVGEYGTSEEGEHLPHYHVAMFGPDMMTIFGTQDIWRAKRGFATHSDKYWKRGRVHIGELNNKSASYICGYTAKKFTNTHEEIVNGREPEFTLQSRRPPLGTAAIKRISKDLLRRQGPSKDARIDSVRLLEKRQVRIDQKIWPLDRQMLKTVYDTIGTTGDTKEQLELRMFLRSDIRCKTGALERGIEKATAFEEKRQRRALHIRKGHF